MTYQDNKKHPLYKGRIGKVKTAIWENQHGESTFLSATLTQSYKDSNGDWKDASINLSHDELLNAAKLLECAETFISSQQ